MHPWHDCYLDEHSVERSFPVVIEVPQGSKNKYELDKETGLLRLDQQVVVEDLLGPTEARRIVRAALELHRQLRRGELRH